MFRRSGSNVCKVGLTALKGSVAGGLALALAGGAWAAPGQAAAPGSTDTEERRVTRALNAEILARNQRAEQAERAEQMEREARYQAQLAEAEADAERFRAEQRAWEIASQEAQARHERAMADWRATVEACRRGDTARCRAGQTPAIPGN